MKLKNVLCGTVFLLPILLTTAFGQRQEITEAQFIAATRITYTIMSKETYRIRETQESFRDSKLTATTTSVTEHIRRERSHFLYGADAPAKPREEIIVGREGYGKEGDANWVKLAPITPSGPRTPTPKITSVYYALPNAKMNGKDVKRYEAERTTTGVHIDRKAYTMYSRWSYWFDMDGRYLKVVTETTQKDSPVSSRKTEIYEYDPNIRIEPPIK